MDLHKPYIGRSVLGIGLPETSVEIPTLSASTYERAAAQVGIVGNDLNALKANYQDMFAQIKLCAVRPGSRSTISAKEAMRRSLISSFDPSPGGFGDGGEESIRLSGFIVGFAPGA